MKILKEISATQRQKLKDLQAKLDHHKRALEKIDYTADPKDFLGYMHRFREFISSYDDEETFAYFEHSEYYQQNRAFFTSIDYSRIIETIEALNFMRDSNTEHQKFLDNFNRLLAKEFSLVDWRGKDKVVMVGSGPLPGTILHIYNHTRAKQIVGLDSNQESIYIAGQVIRRISRDTPRIKLLHYSALTYDYRDADLIYVANFVRPKAQVLNRIAATAGNGVPIIVRTPISFGKMIFDSALEKLNPRLTVTREETRDGYFLGKTLVMKKLDI